MKPGMDATDSDGAESLRYVYVDRPQCPACGSKRLETQRSESQGDGTVKRHTRCKKEDCNHHFFIIVE
jgi:hypothetical protein